MNQPVTGPYAARRVLLSLLGMQFMTFGIAGMVRSALGTAPITTLPLALSYLGPLSFGMTTFAFNVLFVVLQACVLRSRFSGAALVQVPLVFVFGAMIDANMFCTASLACTTLCSGVALNALSVACNAFGVALLLAADVVMMPVDSFSHALSQTLRVPFGRIKSLVDTSIVLAAAFTGWRWIGFYPGIGWGSLFCALACGAMVRLFARPAKRLACGLGLTAPEENLP